VWPFRIGLGPLALTPVEVFAFLGVLLVAWVSRRRMAELGVRGGTLWDLALAALVGGSIGARLFYFLPLWVRGLEPGANLVGAWSEGSGFFGGLLGGSAAVALVARLKGLPAAGVLDAAAAPLPLGFAVGKVGCFLAGCCYGRPCEGFPGVRFAPGSLAGDARAVHPTQLYELALAVLLFGILSRLARRPHRPGSVYGALLAGYSIWRFGIEFLRDDPGRHGFGAALSDSQIAALGVLAGVAGVAAWRAVRGRVHEPRPPGRNT
jgi:phosphatidylglycerol:prolipoprotein diacylglycerol transferase